MYKADSVAEKGTMFQLRNIISRANVPSDPQNNMNAAEDFMLLLLHTHVVAAAKTIMELVPVTDPSELARLILVNFFLPPKISDDSKQHEIEIDGVHLYAKELLSLGLMWHAFHDSIKEGDGDRILRHWKFLVVIFKSTNHRNYAKDAVNLLVQYHTLSERQREQLLWSRCVNTHGRQGKNIPCDLHMEHLNRRLKTVLRNMGGNIKPSSVVKAAKAIGPVQHVCQSFEAQTSSAIHCDRHSYPAFGKDFDVVLNVLTEEKVFTPVGRRKHKSFDLHSGLMRKYPLKDLEKKVKKNIRDIVSHC